MTSPYRELTVRLQRDAFNTPWGFRLQGGTDFQAPLTVQRVFAGSPSQLDLQRGDTILQIENVDVTNMTHRKAQDIIRTAGSTLTLFIKRGPKLTQHTNTRTTPALPLESITSPSPTMAHFRSRSWDSSLLPAPSPEGALVFIPKPPTQPAVTMRTPPQYGVDYRSRPASRNYIPHAFNKPQLPKPSSMLNKLNASLSNRLWTPGEDTYYDNAPIQNGVNGFNGAPPRSHSSHAIRNTEPVVYGEADYDRRTVAELKGKFSKPWKQNMPVYPKDRSTSSAAPAPYLGPTDHISVDLPTWLQYQKPTYLLEVSEEDQRPVSELKYVFDLRSKYAPDPVPQKSPKLPVSRVPARAPAYDSRSLPTAHSKSREAPLHRNVPVNARLSHVMNSSVPGAVPHIDYQQPAWKGTLRGSGPPHEFETRAHNNAMEDYLPSQPVGPAQVVTPHQPRLQKMTYSGDGAATYSQHNPSTAEAPTATGAHLQYNSPMNLYSRSNAEQSMDSQLKGTPAEGTVQMTGGGQYGSGGAYTAPNQKPEKDFSKSSLARMIQEEDSRKSARSRSPAPKGPSGGALYGHAAGTAQVNKRYGEAPAPVGGYAPVGQQQLHSPAIRTNVSARNLDHAPGQEMTYSGYQDQQHQSPSMRALQHHVEDVAAGGGFSDF